MRKIEKINKLKCLYNEYTEVQGEIDRINKFAEGVANNDATVKIYMESEAVESTAKESEIRKTISATQIPWLVGIDPVGDDKYDKTYGDEDCFEVKDTECLHILGFLLSSYTKRREDIQKEINRLQ